MSLRRALAQAAAQHYVSTVIFFASSIATARLLTTSEVGAFTIAFAIYSAAGALREGGLSNYVVSQKNPSADLLSRAYCVVLLQSLGVAALLFALCGPVSHVYGTRDVGWNLAFFALSQFVLSLTFPAITALIRDLRFDSLLIGGLALALAQAGTGVTLAYLGCGSTSLSLGHLAGSIAQAVALGIISPASLRLRPSLHKLGPLFLFGGWVSGTSLVANITTALPDLLIGRLIGISPAALYARANSLSGLIRTGFYTAIARPLFSGFSDFDRRSVPLGPVYLRLVGSVTAFSWPAYALLGIWGEPIIRLLYGEKWIAVASVIPPVALYQAIMMAVTGAQDILVLRRRVSRMFGCESIVFVASAILLPPAMLLGLQAACWTLVFTGLVSAGCYLFQVSRALEVKATAILNVWLRSLLVTILTAIPALAIRFACGPDMRETIIAGIVAGACSLVVWIGSLRLAEHDLHDDVWRLLDLWFWQPAHRFFTRQPG